MRTNIIYPLFEESDVNHTIVTNNPVNLDNVTHLTFEEDWNSKRGYSRIIFHLTNDKKHEWVFGKIQEYNKQYTRLKEISISDYEFSTEA